ncbi:MAG: hypothetical protein IT433_05845 [Phycisphaerales bacterium]|nr:hypothetical protein [Phycisphaerales bacterium]
MDAKAKKNAILLSVAGIALAGAAYLIFFKGKGESDEQRAANVQGDRVTEAMQAGGASTAPPPEIQRPSVRGAVNSKGSR